MGGGQRLSEIHPAREAAAGSRKLRAADKAADASDKQLTAVSQPGR